MFAARDRRPGFKLSPGWLAEFLFEPGLDGWMKEIEHRNFVKADTCGTRHSAANSSLKRTEVYQEMSCRSPMQLVADAGDDNIRSR